MIIKQKNGTVLEMTTKEFSELGNVLGDAVESEESKVTTEFEAGDEVEVTGNSITGRDDLIGERAKIISISKEGDTRVICLNKFLGTYAPSSLKLIEEEPEEVLSYENVKVGEYFVVTDTTSGHRFKSGEVVKSLDTSNDDCFSAERTGDSYWWWADVLYTNVRRATAEEIAEATKPKDVKFEVGDVVKVGAFDFATITQDIDPDGDYPVKYIENGSFNFAEPSNIRHATEEEKSHLQTLIGREKDEYKIGDLVGLLDHTPHGLGMYNGCIFEIASKNASSVVSLNNKTGNEFIHSAFGLEEIKLITPVEWRHDFI